MKVPVKLKAQALNRSQQTERNCQSTPFLKSLHWASESIFSGGEGGSVLGTGAGLGCSG